MKKNLKVIFIISILTLVFSFFTVSISAESSVTDAEIGELSDTDTGITEESVPEEESIGEGIFPTLYTFFKENIAQIFSTLSFLGTAILVLTYKKGLLPFVAQGISTVAAGVKSLGERTAEIKNETGVHNGELKERLLEAERLLHGMESTVSALDEKLRLSENDAKSKERYECVLNAQIDMLYEIFMAAALPQYLKERVGDRVAEMKHALEGDGNEEA